MKGNRMKNSLFSSDRNDHLGQATVGSSREDTELGAVSSLTRVRPVLWPIHRTHYRNVPDAVCTGVQHFNVLSIHRSTFQFFVSLVSPVDSVIYNTDTPWV